MCQLVLNSVSTHDLDDLATSWITNHSVDWIGQQAQAVLLELGCHGGSVVM